jgi:hypothetical protein
MTIRLIAFSLFLTTASVASAQTVDEARVSLALRMFELMDAKGNIERAMSAGDANSPQNPRDDEPNSRDHHMREIEPKVLELIKKRLQQ